MSNEKTIGVVDGSGCLYDPAGIDKAELVRLARARKMVSHVDKSKLSAQGRLVLCEEKVRVPGRTSYMCVCLCLCEATGVLCVRLLMQAYCLCARFFKVFHCACGCACTLTLRRIC